MKIVVIGLGYYGKSVAERLSEAGHEVICVDNRMSNIESIKDSVSAAFAFDATDIGALSSIPVKDTDLCIVTIGEDLGASVRIIALLKKLGARHIFVRASDPVHRSIVDAFNVDRIIMPEDDSARDFVAQLQLTPNIKAFSVAKGFGVFRFPVPDSFVGKSIGDTGLQSKYGLSAIALVRACRTVNDIGISTTDKIPENDMSSDTILNEGDELVCYGPEKGLLKLGGLFRVQERNAAHK